MNLNLLNWRNVYHSDINDHTDILEKCTVCNIRSWGGTPIYFLYTVGTFRQSGYHFQGSLSYTGYTISHFHVSNKVVPVNLLLPPPPPPPLPPLDHLFCAPSLRCVKTQTYVPFLVFWIWPAWSSLEQSLNPPTQILPNFMFIGSNRYKCLKKYQKAISRSLVAINFIKSYGIMQHFPNYAGLCREDEIMRFRICA